MFSYFSTLAVIPDLIPGAIGTVVTVVISFIAITLVASYYRFQHIVELAENVQPEELGATSEDILRIQLARYLAGCARRNSSFSLSFIHSSDPALSMRMDSPFVTAVKHAVREEDIVCVFDDQTAALLTELEPEDGEAVLARVLSSVSGLTTEAAQLRVGMSSYPGHGLSGKELLAATQQALAQASDEQPIVMPEIIDYDEDDDEDDAADPASAEEMDAVATAEKRNRTRKSSMLDELTGVLKPSAVSAYMQRTMSDLRRKRVPVALFAIGVNKMETVTKFHGADAADDVLVGVSEVLQEHLRADDLIGRHEKYAFLVLMQVTHEQAELIGRRLSTLVQQREMISGTKKLKTTLTVGVAVYPEHGRNLHLLYESAQKVLDYNRENDIRAYAVYHSDIHGRMPSKPMRSIKSRQA